MHGRRHTRRQCVSAGRQGSPITISAVAMDKIKKAVQITMVDIDYRALVQLASRDMSDQLPVSHLRIAPRLRDLPYCS
jgi:hypothetical protein